MSLEEAIKGLECCEGVDEHARCAKCPYYKECSDWVLAGGKPAPLIRDALEWLKKLAKCNHDCKIDCLLDAYNRVVAERDALKKGSGEWISVKDRLPEKEGKYMIYDGDRVDTAKYMYDLGPIWMDTAEGYYDYEATHWMPLPEPPEEG